MFFSGKMEFYLILSWSSQLTEILKRFLATLTSPGFKYSVLGISFQSLLEP